MLTLRELQERFAQAVLGRDDTVLGQHVLANGMTGGITGARRLQVYRNNTLTSLTEALAAVYPVVRRLVGEEFFGYAAREYILTHPSVSGNLHDFGGEFAAFLARFPGAAVLVYLPDVAQVEWAYHQVFHEAEHPPLDLSALAGVSPEQYGELRFRLHPASRLLTSSYPVLRIWAVNQEGFEGEQTVDLAEVGVSLLIIRRGLEVMLEPLSEGECALLQAFAAELPFAQACAAALAAQPDIDLTAALQDHVLRGTLVGFSLNGACEATTVRSQR